VWNSRTNEFDTRSYKIKGMAEDGPLIKGQTILVVILQSFMQLKGIVIAQVGGKISDQSICKLGETELIYQLPKPPTKVIS
jgi:hypothetical protein